MTQHHVGPNDIHPRDFPTWGAYQAARSRLLLRDRILRLHQSNSNLSFADIAGHTGVSADFVKEVLFPGGEARNVPAHSILRLRTP